MGAIPMLAAAGAASALLLSPLLAASPTSATTPAADDASLSDLIGTDSYTELGQVDVDLAEKMLSGLEVGEADPSQDYDRAKHFGSGWLDPDGNGCDARNDTLARDLTDITLDADDCTVLTGTLEDVFTGTTIDFERGPESSKVQIDHMVPLEYLWTHGAEDLTAEQRREVANDPDNLTAIDGSTNASKGSRGPGEWMPPNEDYSCTYAARFVYVLHDWDMMISPEDAEAVQEEFDSCPNPLPEETPSPTPTESESPRPTGTPTPPPTTPAPSEEPGIDGRIVIADEALLDETIASEGLRVSVIAELDDGAEMTVELERSGITLTGSGDIASGRADVLFSDDWMATFEPLAGPLRVTASSGDDFEISETFTIRSADPKPDADEGDGSEDEDADRAPASLDLSARELTTEEFAEHGIGVALAGLRPASETELRLSQVETSRTHHTTRVVADASGKATTSLLPAGTVTAGIYKVTATGEGMELIERFTVIGDDASVDESHGGGEQLPRTGLTSGIGYLIGAALALTGIGAVAVHLTARRKGLA